MNLWGGTDPTLVPGIGDLEKYDARWLECLTAYEESTRVSFPRGGTIIEIPSKVTIALAGDWGAGIPTNVAKIMAELGADFTVHLGDVYYTGNEQEHSKFAWDWPAGKLGSFTLPGNHDLYSGGQGLLDTLSDPKFAAQGGGTYFALRNDDWLIVGLDTSSATTDWLYKNGVLDAQQETWLKLLLADSAPRRIIFLTHHDLFNLAALDETGERADNTIIYKPLWTQLEKYFLAPADRVYTGHVHSAVVYDNGCRCIGHAGVPYLPFLGLVSDYGDADIKVLWAESDTIPNTQRAPAGFAVIRLDGLTITEQIVDELGRERWRA